MSRKLRVRPSPTGSLIGGIIALIIAGIGIAVVIPNAGAFGVFWTLAALVGAGLNFYNAFSKDGIASEIIEAPDDPPAPADAESRLRRLNDLKTKGLITAAEYQQRRVAILSEI